MRRTRCLIWGVSLALGLLPTLAHAAVDTVWVRRYAQPGYCNDEATAMVADRAGNVYVTGSSQRVEAGLKDFATVKYNSAGVQQWAARYEESGNSIPNAICVDGVGNVYVTGASESTGTNWDYLTVKYNSAGVEQWRDRYNGPGNAEDKALSVCVDSAGNVGVCGYITNPTQDWTVIGYTPSGVRTFVTPTVGVGDNTDVAYAITADPQGTSTSRAGSSPGRRWTTPQL